jgi:hypothetical protein
MSGGPTDLFRADYARATLPSRRRRVLIVALALLLAQGFAIIFWPSLVHFGHAWNNRWFGGSSEEMLQELVQEGKLRPATHSEVRAWFALARINGNDELDDPDLYDFMTTYVLTKPVTLPRGMYGAHSKQFIVPAGGQIPFGAIDSHNAFMFAENGACVGALPGCTLVL